MFPFNYFSIDVYEYTVITLDSATQTLWTDCRESLTFDHFSVILGHSKPFTNPPSLPSLFLAQPYLTSLALSHTFTLSFPHPEHQLNFPPLTSSSLNAYNT